MSVLVDNNRQLKKKNKVNPNQLAFLSAYSMTGNISSAARAASINRTVHYQLMKAEPSYVEAFNHARETAIDSLAATARERAENGSDTLLIFLLKALRPETYRERFEHHHSGELTEVSFVINGSADDLASSKKHNIEEDAEWNNDSPTLSVGEIN